MPKANQLIDKPLPVQRSAACSTSLRASGGSAQIQFLVDTRREWELARRQKPLRINLEIDVGLHRGSMEPGALSDAGRAGHHSVERAYGI